MANNNKNLSLALNPANFASNNLSPMTDLAFNMCTLSTTSYTCTPKRRISWSGFGTPSAPCSEDSGFIDSGINRPNSDRLKACSCNPPFIHPLHCCNDKENIDYNAEVTKAKNGSQTSPIKSSEKLETFTPTNFHHLLKQPLLSSNFLNDSPFVYSDNINSKPNNQDTPANKGRSCIRGLFTRNDRFMTNKVGSKRSDAWQSETPIHKRRKAFSFCAGVPETKLFAKPELQRSHSETEATIMKALQLSAENPDLIGDFSRPYVLPLVPSKHQDLKSISSETMGRLLLGEFNDLIEEHVVVDCRFPYEFEAGHIQGARNIYTKEGVMEEFFDQTKLENCKKRSVIIFHCEFSSERGPALTRFLRSTDRSANDEHYPNLHYPEIYLLSGGYKEFYETCKQLCVPQAYKPMLHKDHENEMRIFRARSKSWQGSHKSCMRLGLKILNQKLP